MRLIITRHGNTFGPGDTPYFVGSKEDLPLVDSGIAQARAFGNVLKSANINPTAWYSGPLTRTRQYIRFAMEALGINSNASSSNGFPIIDQRLVELDYGTWSGLTEQEVIEKFGAKAQQDWASQAIWPENADWKPPEDQVRKEAFSFLDDMKARYKNSDTVVAASSGGRMRYFLATIPAEFEKRRESNQLKIATGNLCILDHTNGTWSLCCWDSKPGEVI